MIQNLRIHWKSNVQALLTLFLVLGPFLLTDGSPIKNKTAIWAIGALSAAAKLWVAAITKDAGVVEASVPGAGVQSVSSHEVPDDPKAKPVVSK